MKINHLKISICVVATLAACTRELPPRTVSEFREDPILLEATMVHCAQDRALRKYEVECVNAREAINLIARAEEEASRAQMEAQSERKRRAVRRAQEAAAEARRHSAEAEKLRLEAEYLGQFDPVPDGSEQRPVGESGSLIQRQPVPVPAPSVEMEIQPGTKQETAPVSGSDLDAIRQELERRQNQGTSD